MSKLFRSPHVFVKHDDFKVNDTTSVNAVDAPELKQDCKSSSAANNQSVLLRDDHIVLLAIDGLLALRASFKRWRKRRRTLRTLADLDERQLRDIGLAREETLSETPFKQLGDHKSYRVLTELVETQLCSLSERGLQVQREMRRR